MPDRDLTTEGHALLEAAGWDPTHDRLTLRDGALWVERPNGSGDGLTEQLPPWAGYLGELIVWAVNSAPRLLDIVDEARKRLEGHEKSVDRLVRERDRARAQFGLLFDALVERDASFTTEQGRVVAVKVPTLDEQRARIAELETERDADRIAEEFGIKSLSVEDGVPTLAIEPTTEQARELVLAMSLACGRMLDDDQAPNYVEFEVSPATQLGYIVHVRRAGGPTPHTLRREAEARIAELERQQKDQVRSAQVVFAMDLWVALGCPIGEFEPYLERNRVGDTWANLLGVVRDLFVPKCGKPTDGGPCVLSAHEVGPCYARGDVGSSEPVPHADSRIDDMGPQAADRTAMGMDWPEGNNHV